MRTTGRDHVYAEHKIGVLEEKESFELICHGQLTMENFYSLVETDESSQYRMRNSGVFKALCQDDERNDFFMLPEWLYPWEDILDYSAPQPREEDVPSASLEVLNAERSSSVHSSRELAAEGSVPTVTLPVSMVTVNHPSNKPPSDRNDGVTNLQICNIRSDLPDPSPTQAPGVNYQISFGEPLEFTSPASASCALSKSKYGRRKRYSRPYQCPMCDKAFRTMSAQSIHMRMHSGDRPFTCDVCDHKFIRKQNLAAHMRVHDPNSHFSCPQCSMSFRHKHDRDVHVLTFTCARWTRHILDSPDEFFCTTCSSSFEDSNTLLHHVRQHNRGLGYSCPVCAIPFIGMKSHAIVKHVRNAHPDYVASLNLD